MVPPGMRRCLMAIAALVALVATESAFAADQCVLEVASGLREAPPMSLDPDRPDAIVIEGELVPISLAIGASAVAPRTIHAISDATIEAERACEGASAGAQSGVSQDDQRDRTDPPLALDARLGHGEIAVLPADARLVASSRPTDAPARGVARPIERPPRR
jgi:hypothetical protein